MEIQITYRLEAMHYYYFVNEYICGILNPANHGGHDGKASGDAKFPGVLKARKSPL